MPIKSNQIQSSQHSGTPGELEVGRALLENPALSINEFESLLQKFNADPNARIDGLRNLTFYYSSLSNNSNLLELAILEKMRRYCTIAY